MPRADVTRPPAWRPDSGDVLEGTITALDERENEYGFYPLLTVDAEDRGQTTWHVFSTVAQRELGKLRPKVGERIVVTYRGKQQSKGRSDRSYQTFEIELPNRPRPVFSWERYAAEDADKSWANIEPPEDDYTSDWS